MYEMFNFEEIWLLLFQGILGMSLILTYHARKYRLKFKDSFLKTSYLIIFCLDLVAVSLVDLHLGSLFHAFYMVTRLFSSSILPLEVMFASLFTFFAFIRWREIKIPYLDYVVSTLGVLCLGTMIVLYGNMSMTNLAWAYKYTFLGLLQLQ